MEELSAEELAGRSGVTAEQLGRLVELGILTPTSEGRYRRSDIQRIRVVQAMEEAGFAPEQLAQLIAAGAYNLDWTGVIYPEPTAQSATTLEEAVAATRAMTSANNVRGFRISKAVAPEWRLVGSDARKRITSR